MKILLSAIVATLTFAGVVQAGVIENSFSQSFSYRGLDITYSYHNWAGPSGRDAYLYTGARAYQGRSGNWYQHDHSSWQLSSQGDGEWQADGQIRFIEFSDQSSWSAQRIDKRDELVLNVEGVAIELATMAQNMLSWNSETGQVLILDDLGTNLSLDIESASAVIDDVSVTVYDEQIYNSELDEYYSDRQYVYVQVEAIGHLPEPASMALMGLGGLTMLRCRRRVA